MPNQNPPVPPPWIIEPAVTVDEFYRIREALEAPLWESEPPGFAPWSRRLPEPAVEPEQTVEPAAYCDHCGDPIGSADDVIAVLDDRYDRNHAAQVGRHCCVENGRREHVFSTCAQSGRVVYSHCCIFLSDTEEYVHNALRHGYTYCEHNGEWYSDADNMPEPPEPDLEENGLYYYGANVLQLCSHAEPGRRLVMGVELEMECEGYSVERTLGVVGGARQNKYILKSDGSLSDGIELVTIPMTLREHVAFDWEQSLRPYRIAGCVSGSTRTCGMHVHVNRAALSPLTIGKILVFVNSDKRDTHALVTQVAQRRENSYCDRNAKRVRDGKERSGSKYEAIHMLPKTIEFRIFRGNMRTERILKNLEFVHALCSYMPSCSVAHCEDAGRFLQWLNENRKAYPNLCLFLAEKNARPALFTEPHDDEMREDSEDEAQAA